MATVFCCPSCGTNLRVNPATALLEQVRHDPDGDVLHGLMTAWYAVFDTTPTTVRKAVEAATYTSERKT